MTGSPSSFLIYEIKTRMGFNSLFKLLLTKVWQINWSADITDLCVSQIYCIGVYIIHYAEKVASVFFYYYQILSESYFFLIHLWINCNIVCLCHISLSQAFVNTYHPISNYTNTQSNIVRLIQMKPVRCVQKVRGINFLRVTPGFNRLVYFWSFLPGERGCPCVMLWHLIFCFSTLLVLQHINTKVKLLSCNFFWYRNCSVGHRCWWWSVWESKRVTRGDALTFLPGVCLE